MKKNKKGGKKKDEDGCWWVERYIRMSKAEIRRANNGGNRAYNKRKKKESEFWEI